MDVTPFSPYANSTLTFTIESGEFVTDPETGNQDIVATKDILIKAYLTPDNSPKAIYYPGIDQADTAIKGRLVNPKHLPLDIQHLATAIADIGGQQGTFTLMYPVQDAFGVQDILGDKIYGVLRRQV